LIAPFALSRGVFWAALVAAATLLYSALYETGLLPFLDMEV
jgi:hypothetical protein